MRRGRSPNGSSRESRDRPSRTTSASRRVAERTGRGRRRHPRRRPLLESSTWRAAQRAPPTSPAARRPYRAPYARGAGGRAPGARVAQSRARGKLDAGTRWPRPRAEALPVTSTMSGERGRAAAVADQKCSINRLPYCLYSSLRSGSPRPGSSAAQRRRRPGGRGAARGPERRAGGAAARLLLTLGRPLRPTPLCISRSLASPKPALQRATATVRRLGAAATPPGC